MNHAVLLKINHRLKMIGNGTTWAIDLLHALMPSALRHYIISNAFIKVYKFSTGEERCFNARKSRTALKRQIFVTFVSKCPYKCLYREFSQ